MGKYDPLGQFLRKQKQDRVNITFTEIERVIGAKLPKSSKTHRAWWSNNPTNNVMTREWLEAGYETEDVDIAAERLVFRKTSPEPRRASSDGKPSFFGFMKGMITFAPDFDPAHPVFDDIDWDNYEIGGLEDPK